MWKRDAGFKKEKPQQLQLWHFPSDDFEGARLTLVFSVRDRGGLTPCYIPPPCFTLHSPGHVTRVQGLTDVRARLDLRHDVDSQVVNSSSHPLQKVKHLAELQHVKQVRVCSVELRCLLRWSCNWLHWNGPGEAGQEEQAVCSQEAQFALLSFQKDRMRQHHQGELITSCKMMM